MAEIVGLVVGGVSLATMFSAVVGFCECVRFGKSFGQDYETALTKLNVVRLRLSRWAEAVRKENKDIGTAEDGKEALRILERIKYHFEQAEKLSTKYIAKGGENTTLYDPQHETKKDVRSLVDAISRVVAQRQKKASAFQKTAWAVYDKNRFNTLLQDVTELVDGLVDLFPVEKFPSFHEQQMVLYEQDMKQLRTESRKALKILAVAAGSVDMTLQSAIKMEIETCPRHIYIGNEVSGRARARFGDEVMNGYAIQVTAKGHVFHGNKVHGDSIIHYGDTFGGKSIFDKE